MPLPEAGPYNGLAWRLVEAQHKASTMKLVDDLDEQALLEDLIEVAKPPLPPECAGLHYLLATPFRYGAPYPHGSRFRRAGITPGVWYGAENPETAVAEIAFYRLLFHAESPGTPLPVNAASFTGLAVPLAAERHIDLTGSAHDHERAALEHRQDYTRCQVVADEARAAGIGLIRYRSVRDPAARANLAVLACMVFAAREPAATRTWHLRMTPGAVMALCENPRTALTFPREVFAEDGRV